MKSVKCDFCGKEYNFRVIRKISDNVHSSIFDERLNAIRFIVAGLDPEDYDACHKCFSIIKTLINDFLKGRVIVITKRDAEMILSFLADYNNKVTLLLDNKIKFKSTKIEDTTNLIKRIEQFIGE